MISILSAPVACTSTGKSGLIGYICGEQLTFRSESFLLGDSMEEFQVLLL